MSRIVLNLENEENGPPAEGDEPSAGENGTEKRPAGLRKILIIVSIVILMIPLILAVGGGIYWQYLKSTPQYSIALLVDASRRDDRKTVDNLIDTDAVVEDFVPQIVEKAVDLYGRGLPPSIVRSITRVATPFLPVIKRRARAEFPKFLREKTEKYENIPFPLMVIAAGRYIEIKQDGDTAEVKSKVSDRPLSLTMKREDGMWRITGVEDDELAEQIAEKIGQEMIALAKNRGTDTINDLGRQIGVPNLGDILNRAEDVYK